MKWKYLYVATRSYRHFNSSLDSFSMYMYVTYVGYNSTYIPLSRLEPCNKSHTVPSGLYIYYYTVGTGSSWYKTHIAWEILVFYAIYMATRPRACIFHKTLGHAISITYCLNTFISRILIAPVSVTSFSVLFIRITPQVPLYNSVHSLTWWPLVARVGSCRMQSSNETGSKLSSRRKAGTHCKVTLVMTPSRPTLTCGRVHSAT